MRPSPSTCRAAPRRGARCLASRAAAAASYFVCTTLPRSARLITLAAALGFVLAWTMPSQAQAQAQAPGAAHAAPPVIVATSTEADDNVTLNVIGNGVAQQSVTLYPAVAGEVAQVNFRTGERVKAGQILFRLVDRSQKLAADLAAARVDAAQALARRYEGTRGTGAVPESVVDEARAALRAAQIEREQALEDVADRAIRAPFDGVMGLTQVEVGDRVTTDTALVTLDDRRALRLDFEVPEAYLSRVAARQPLTAINPAYPQRTFDGAITEVDTRVDPTTRNVRVRATLPNADDLLRSGMSFQVQLQLSGQTYVSVPELALQWGRDGSFVWAVREGQSVQVAARPVRRTAGRVLIDSELKAGETVVVEGVQRLRAGRPVRVIGSGS
ncbi:MAG: efflux RND transporter periplasmic adaptor subunit [Comamonadaceae bacterium]|nr:efflux RND transporter periplasmic adaptor subunit [Comamonadaceae bacterium]